jgi:hypothetical protein
VTREQLAHVLRAAAKIAEDADIVVIGSQAILGSYSHRDLPPETTLSMEVDIAFHNDPDETKADKVDGAIGEGSRFHATHSYYGQGVAVTTAVLPAGWEERVVRFGRKDALPSQAVCIEAHDLVVAKLVAGREKDIDFAIALIKAELVDYGTLLDRANLLNKPGAVIKRVRSAIARCVSRAQPGVQGNTQGPSG